MVALWSPGTTSPRTADGTPRPPPDAQAQDGQGRRLGLRAHLLVLALAVLLPSLAVGALAAWQAVGSYRAAFQARLQDTARALAIALDARIEADIAALRALADAPFLDPGMPTELRESALRRTADSLGLQIGLLDPSGRYLLHTALPSGAPLPPTRRTEELRRVVENGRLAVLDLAPGAVEGRPIVAIMVPVLREGGVVAVLGGRLEPGRLLAPLRAQGLSGGGFATLLDGANRVVARTRNHEALLGQPAPPWFAPEAAGQERGLVVGPNVEGSASVAAFERLGMAPGWTVLVVAPRAAYLWTWLRPLGLLALSALPLLALSGALALWLARRLLRPVEALRHHARTVISGGGGGAAAATAGGGAVPAPGEGGGVAEFEALRTDIAAAEARLRAGEERWRSLFEGMHEGFALCEIVRDAAGQAVDYRRIELNAAFERLTGIPVAVALGRTAREVQPDLEPSWVETFARVVETGEPARYVREMAGIGRWFEGHAYRVGPDRFAVLFFDVTERKRSEERQRLLAREVDHRAKNALAVVQAALRLTRAEDVPGYVRAVEGRVAALARAHTLLAEDRWAGADLRALLQGELAPFLGGGAADGGGDGGGPRVELDGPEVVLPAGAAQPLGMAVHELATNALKHGALSVPGGRVAVSWRVLPGADRRLRLRWAETGGPPIARPPEGRGFGRRMLDGTLRGQLGGSLAFDWGPAGLVCEIELPLGERGTAAAGQAAAE